MLVFKILEMLNLFSGYTACFASKPLSTNKSLNCKQYLIVSIFLMLSIALSIPKVQAQSGSAFCEEFKNLLELLETKHYSPPILDTDLSEKIFDRFIKLFDTRAIYLTQKELESLLVWRNQWLDKVKAQDCLFFEELAQVIKSTLERSLEITQALGKKPLNFEQDDLFRLYAEGTLTERFVPDEVALAKRTESLLRYEVLQLLYYQSDSLALLKTWDKAYLQQVEEALRLKIVEKIQCKIQKYLNHPDGFEKRLKNTFFNAFTYFYDPHTAYFSPEILQAFAVSLSSEDVSIGLGLGQNDKEEIIVSHLVPGGTAWKSNNIFKDEVILQVQVGLKTLEMNVCTDPATIEEFIRTESSRKVSLTIRQSSGQTKTVVLYKEKVENEENIVKSHLLQGDKKIGYIALPGFYSSFEEDNAAGCANDVAKEIIKLKTENIEGLILDVRQNGGGSLKEALDLAGIFIEDGVLSILKNRQEKPLLLKDPNRGTIYDGPLIILVNPESASASEILAAVLQDYQRALVVGSLTYGKSSGQVVLPIKGSSLAFAKVTIDKFYRVTGLTYQRQGVLPDIKLPDPLSVLISREADQESSLPNDTLDKKVIYKILPALPKEVLAAKSQARIKEKSFFKNIHQFISTQNNQERVGESPLKPEKFKAAIKSKVAAYQYLLADNPVPSTLFVVKNHQYDETILAINAYKKELNDTLLKDIQADAYIEEAYQIMCDWLEINK